MYNFGTVILVPFPFTDLTSEKVRPALIISDQIPGEDIMVAFITSSKDPLSPGISIRENIPEFVNSGLKTTSLIRLDEIATLDKKIVLGELGSLPTDFLKKHSKIFYKQFGF